MPTEKLQAFIDGMPFAKEVGIFVKEAKRGFVSLSVKPKPTLFSHFGTYQAGALFTLAEVTGGAILGTFFDLSENLLLCKQGEIFFQKGTSAELISKARLDELSIQGILAELKDRKKKDFSVDVTIEAGGTETILRARFLYYVRSGIPRSFK